MFALSAEPTDSYVDDRLELLTAVVDVWLLDVLIVVIEPVETADHRGYRRHQLQLGQQNDCQLLAAMKPAVTKKGSITIKYTVFKDFRND